MTTPTGRWMFDNSWKFGWALSYPLGKGGAIFSQATCFHYEPWHYRYLGRKVAKEVHDSGLTIREYLWEHYTRVDPETGEPIPTATPTPSPTPSPTASPTPVATASPDPVILRSRAMNAAVRFAATVGVVALTASSAHAQSWRTLDVARQQTPEASAPVAVEVVYGTGMFGIRGRARRRATLPSGP